MKPAQQGFTLIEVTITVAIVGILAAVAMPAYLHYARKAAYTEVLAQAVAVKNALTTCLSVEQDVAKCNTLAALGISPPSSTPAFNSLTLDATDLTITLIPNAFKGIRVADTCDLKPAVDRRSNSITGWYYVSSSPCVVEGYVKP
jgi:type IV pilus assembly protein PilA